ncbi:AAA family ATPase [Cellulomonas sp. P5_C5]
MQLAELTVRGLFGKYDHRVPFPTASEEDAVPSVVILHGRNGIGKTTVLRMLNGMMALDFSAFRAVPFGTARLVFNTGSAISVARRPDGVLVAEFDGGSALLSPDQSGPWREQDVEDVENFRNRFKTATELLSFEYLGTRRDPLEEVVAGERAQVVRAARNRLVHTGSGELSDVIALEAALAADRHRDRGPRTSLAEKVKRFIREAQLDSPSYFRSNQPDLFIRVIDELANPGKAPMKREEIVQTLSRVHEMEATHLRLGLGRDQWDFERLMGILGASGSNLDERVLAVLGTYTEFLESRAGARQLIAERLLTFESVMDEFLFDKYVRVDARQGLTINGTDEVSSLSESQLSSGEFQLLYLMVSALTTRRRGTIIAIDEPELSMHVGWQRKLLPSLIRCASRAAPQFVIATHSPDVAAGYPQSLIELSGSVMFDAET